MEAEHAKELDYGITMAVNTLVTALGMHWKNQADLQSGAPPTYNQQHFDQILDNNSTHHNNVIERWQGK